MNSDEIFNQWKQRRSSVEDDPDFTQQIMDQIAVNSPLSQDLLGSVNPRLAESRPSSMKSPWLVAAMFLLSIGSLIIHLLIILFFSLTTFNQGI